MASSSRIIDYLGEGTAASRPASLSIASTALGLYYATDTKVLSLWNGASWDVLSSGGTAYNVPAAATFSFVNQNSATLTDHTNGPLVWSCPTTLGSDEISAAHKAVPSGSWTLTCLANYLETSDGLMFGVDDGTKVHFILVASDGSSPGYQLQVQHWNSFTSPSGSGTDASAPVKTPMPLWLRIVYNSSTPSLSYEYSADGFQWFTIFTESGSLFLTPTNYFFGADINHSAANAPATWSFISLTIG